MTNNQICTMCKQDNPNCNRKCKECVIKAEILYKWIDNGDGVFPTYTCPVCHEVSEDDYPCCPVCKQELADSSSAFYNPVLP